VPTWPLRRGAQLRFRRATKPCLRYACSVVACRALKPKVPQRPEPFFKVVGMVDGVSEELQCPGDDPRGWAHMRPVVVEVSKVRSRARAFASSNNLTRCHVHSAVLL
jgi:hypothetical protein